MTERAPTVLFLALLLPTGAVAGALGDGAAAFEAGELDRAIELWEPAVHAGAPSGRVLYNLGNAWYRKNDLPRAVAYYRAAQRLRPRDGNVHHNLALARAGLEGVPDPVAPAPGWSALLTAGELALGGLAATASGTAMVVAWWRRRARALLWGGLVALALGLGLSAGAWTGASQGIAAVVVDQPIAVRDAPQADAGRLHSLAPGSELRLLDSLGAFHLVEDGDGRRGWVPRNAVLAPGGS